jgi:hypothetical protein
MRKVMVAVLMTSFILTWLSLGHAAESADDSIYYTRVGFSHQKGTHRTTNYLLGTRVEVNTEVEVLKKKKSTISIRIVSTNQQVKIQNVENFSGEDIDGIFERMFSREATDLTAYSPEQVENIMAGNFEPGMTKEEIILAIGYPPKHKTPSLDRNAWRYWQSKWDTVLLYFKDDVLDDMLD